MRPANKQQTRNRLLSKLMVQPWKPLALCLLLMAATAGYLLNNAGTSSEAKAVSGPPVESFEAGLKMGKFKVQLDRDTSTTYRGENGAARAMQDGLRPLTMASEDFDKDGMQDLAVGYAGGLLTLRRGNIEAIAPQSPEVLEGLREGRYPSPFLNDVNSLWLPETPDFLATGDFNADGHADVVAGARYGHSIYLFPGDGHGGLKSIQQITLDGPLTAMTKGQFNEGDGMSDLALGIIAPEGPTALVFNELGKGVLGTPDRFILPEAATTLTLAKLDGDTAGDLAVGAGNQLVIIHGRNQADPDASPQNAIERIALPYSISAIAVGDFLFDREGKSKLALLSNDGTVHLMTPGRLDTRPYTKEELDARQKQRIKIRRGEADAASLTSLEASMVHRPGKGEAWLEAESHSIGAIPAGASPQALLTTTRDAGSPLDQLLVLDRANNKVQLVDDNEKVATLPLSESARGIDSLDLDSAPIAVLTMRLSVDGRPGTVVLQENQSAPGLIIPSAATFNVTSTLDAVDDNPGNGVCHTAANTCTLRAAMMESSYFGGSNTINLLAGTTYTLTLGGIFGGPDDEFNGFGDDQTGGDLDIIDMNRVCSQLGGGNPAAGCPGITLGGTALTSVSVVGGNINTTIIQMGNLVPAAGAPNAGLDKDRILEVNNFADPQFDINVQMSNLTMQNGNAPHFVAHPAGFPGCPTACFYNTPGGAIMYDGINNVSGNPLGTLTLTTVKITNNTASGQGGGVFGLDDTLIVQTSSVVTLNTSTLGSGGGISYGGGNKVTTQTLQILNSTVGGAGAANNAPDLTFGNGAGVSSVGGSGATISNTTISNNTAGNQGGGIALVNTAAIAFSNSTISSNTAKTHGGGIFTSARNAVTNAASTNTLTTTNVTGNTADSDNNASGNGGGIYNLFGTLTVQTTSHIDGNTANNGGGIFDTWNLQTNDLPASVVVNTGSTIGQTGVGNNAKNNGGGIAIDVGGNSATTPKVGSVTLTSVSLVANTANSDNAGGGDGGGIHQIGNDVNFMITSSLNGVTIDNNVANAGGGGGTGDGVFLSSGTMSGVNTVSFNNGDTLNINGGTFTSTSGTLNLTGNFTRAAASTFNHNNGTVNWNGTVAQTIGGTATSDTFNNFIVNKSAGALATGGSTTTITTNDLTMTLGTFTAPATLDINGNTFLNGGTLTAGANITAAGNWSNNGGTFTPGTGLVTFDGAVGQAINGTAATQTFNNFAVNKGGGSTLTTGGSTTSLVMNDLTMTLGTFTAPATLDINGNTLLTAGTLTAGANITAAGNWTNNGGTFTPGSGLVTFDGATANNLTGAAVTQTFNNFAVNKGGGTLTGGGSTTTLTLTGNMSITGGTFAAGTITTINDPGNWSNSATFTAGSSTVNLTGNNNTQTLSGNTTFNNLTCNHTGTGNVTASGSTLAVTGLMRVQSGTFISSSTFNNVQIDSGATLQSDGSTMNVSGNWTNNGGTFTPTGNTVNFNGSGAQAIGGSATTQTFNNFTVNKSGGSTLSVAVSTTTLTITGGVTLTAGVFDKGTATTINVAGNWTNNGGSFTAGAGTVNFNGASAETIGGTSSTTFNNLTDANTLAGGNGITLNGNITVNGVLALGANNIDTSTFTITMPASGSSSGTGDVIGNVKRTGFVLATTYSFGNPLNTIKIESGSIPADINVNLVMAAPTDYTSAVKRKYTITPNGANGPVTLQLHYLDTDLNGNDENTMIFRRFNGAGWTPVTPTSRDTTNNWLQKTGQPTLSPWTFSSSGVPTATSGIITGRITDTNGVPVAGAVVNLSGTQNRKMITDANGNYSFAEVETTGFYTVRATRANYSFSPQERSFSQLGNQTEATFTATPLAATSNPVDTAEYFVRQHYLDFLGREPEESGFNFWSDQLLGCGSDAACAEVKRINVSAAYFLSIEFQETGGLVDGVYRASFARAPNYAEFLPDSATIGKDVIVGRAGWEQQLSTNRQAFLAAFVQRPGFQSVYGAYSNEQYVEQLLTHTRIIWTQAEREALVNGLASGTQTRAAVLGQIAGDQRFVTAKQNQMFVMMEYFGYLRRDPDASGYQFWLNKLNQFNGNFEQAEMVKAFILSAEYRERFPR